MLESIGRMMRNSQIRGSFVRGYAEKRRAYVGRSWELIQKRDDEHRVLNSASGYVDEDGVVPTGRKSHIDLEYKRKYDEIDARFRVPYDAGLPGLYNWCQHEGMSIHEYLWIDNICAGHLEIVAIESTQKPDWQMNYISRKANLLVEHLKVAHTVGEIKHLVDMEVQNHGYASARCRKILDIKLWELGKQKSILDYQHAWKRALIVAWSGLTAR